MINYELVDVFTTVPFAGNQLAVFTDLPELSDEQMQRIASELNLAETTFVWPTDDAQRWRVRIFTPGTELPFAGHPTVGTAVVVARREGLGSSVVLEEKIGSVEVDVDLDADPPRATLTTTTLPERGPGPDIESAYASVSLRRSDGSDRSVESWSCGVPFTILPLADAATSARCVFDMAGWQSTMSDAWGPNIYTLTELEPGRLRARSFVPDAGLIEDPATGAAASALGGYVAEHLGDGDGVHRWVIEQGVEMGRPSEIHLEVSIKSGRVERVRVGGSVVSIGAGQLAVP